MIVTVENGSTAELADFKAYAGTVGVRDKGDVIEIGYFGEMPRAKWPLTATLDGRPIRILREKLPEQDNRARIAFRTLIAEYLEPSA